MKIAVIGAGIAGLAAARHLTINGADVTVFDRSRGVGGRAATRRTGDGQFDHGAPFFGMNAQEFRSVLNQWIDASWVKPWHARCAVSDGQMLMESRMPQELYVPVPRMSSLAAHLAEGLRVQLNSNVTALNPIKGHGQSGWMVSGTQLHPTEQPMSFGGFDAVVVACHPQRARPLVTSSEALTVALADATMLPIWVAMVDFMTPLGLSADVISFETGNLQSAIFDSAKPDRPIGERWVLHSTTEFAQAHYDAAPEVVGQALLDTFMKLKRSGDAPATVVAHRWGAAVSARVQRQGAFWDAEQRLALCGDWCNGVMIESAYLSGVAAARAVMGGE